MLNRNIIFGILSTIFFSFLVGSVLSFGALVFRDNSGATVKEIRRGGPVSLSYLREVRGVALMSVARPLSTVRGGQVRVGYDSGEPDGRRFSVMVAEHSGLIHGPDWLIISAVQYAASEYTAAYTVTGLPDGKTPRIHPVLRNSRMGIILYYVYHTINDPLGHRYDVKLVGNQTELPFVSGFDRSRSLEGVREMEKVKKSSQWDAFLYTDKDAGIEFAIRDSELVFSGHPFVLFWERSRNLDNDGQQPEWTEVRDPTDFFRTNSIILHKIAPAVFQTAERFSQLVSFFRYVKLEESANWNSLIQALGKNGAAFTVDQHLEK